MSHNPAPAPCNICGSKDFSAASSASAVSGRPSKCAGCGSLEHHRVVRTVFNALPRDLLQSAKCLRLTVDPALEGGWFAQVEEGTAGSATADRASASYDWVYATLPLTGSASDSAALADLLRLVGRRCLVLSDGASHARYAAQGELGAQSYLRGSAYGDVLRDALPRAAVLELIGLDSSSLKLESVYVVSLDQPLLGRMAEAIVRRNVHARVFPPKAPPPPLEQVRASLPPELDLAVYRSLNADLAKFSDQALRDHYQKYGEREGRRCNTLADRADFVALLGQQLDVLEIGPFYTPLVSGPRVRYFDIRDQQGLKAHAVALGLSPDRVPEIHFVSPNAELGVVTGTFDAVISSHVVEHQPDFIGHLDSVRRLLRPGGLYFMLVPDRNYCFDHFNPASTIADLLEAHVHERTRHTLRSAVDFAIRGHNEPVRHWAGDHGTPNPSVAEIQRTVKEFSSSDGSYTDVHAWYFEPAAFRESMALLLELGETDFRVLRLYPTQLDHNEFWVVLAADGGAP